MQEYLRRLADIPMEREMAFVWISVNDLSRQSKRSFERNLAGSSLHFSELADISDRELRKNEILFINWEAINKVDSATGEWKVLAMKDNERDENLPIYLQNTHIAGREIILIIDESHRNLDSPRAQELIQNFIKPKIQIEVSATPDST
jgi:type III restriction enzyme